MNTQSNERGERSYVQSFLRLLPSLMVSTGTELLGRGLIQYSRELGVQFDRPIDECTWWLLEGLDPKQMVGLYRAVFDSG